MLSIMSQEAQVQNERRQFPGAVRTVVILVLRVALLVALAGAGWLIYRQLPASTSGAIQDTKTTNLQIVLQPENGSALDVQVSLYPVNVVAVRHEFFSEPRAGKRWDDFLKERMKGRSPVTVKLDKQGNGSAVLAPGSWWLHAKVKGEEEIEWRLTVTVIGAKQVIELTSQNAYTRSRVF